MNPFLESDLCAGFKTKSDHVRSVQYRARKQAADLISQPLAYARGTVSKSRNRPFVPEGRQILAGGVTLRYLHVQFGTHNWRMILPQPKLERRLQKRHHKLVLEHVNVNSEIAAGPRALPGKGKAFASTQGAWRYYANPKVTIKALGEPLIEQARDFVTRLSVGTTRWSFTTGATCVTRHSRRSRKT